MSAATNDLNLSKACDWSFDRFDQKLASRIKSRHAVKYSPSGFFRYFLYFYFCFCRRASFLQSMNYQRSIEEWEKGAPFPNGIDSIDCPSWPDKKKKNFQSLLLAACATALVGFDPVDRKQRVVDEEQAITSTDGKANLLLVTWNLSSYIYCSPCSYSRSIVCKFWPPKLRAMVTIKRRRRVHS